jgi:hypothetical protein
MSFFFSPPQFVFFFESCPLLIIAAQLGECESSALSAREAFEPVRGGLGRC